MTKKKVYCEECRFLKYMFMDCPYCLSPRREFKDSWKSKHEIVFADYHNKSNDCKWFERKE